MSIQTCINIFIVFHNHGRLLKKQLDNFENISSFTDFRFKIWILDNNSHDEPIDKSIIKNYKDLFVNVYSSETNLGYSGGNNLLISEFMRQTYSHEEHILILNPDVFITESLIRSLHLLLLNDPDTFAVSPDEVHSKTSSTRLDSISFNIQQLEAYSYMGKTLHTKIVKNNTYVQSFLCTGACMMLNGSVLRNLGLKFDDSFFMYLEELELIIKAFREGYLSYICANHIIEHNKHEPIMTNRKLYYCTRNSIRILSRIPVQIMPFFVIGRFILPSMRSIKWLLNLQTWINFLIVAEGIRDGFMNRGGIKNSFHH